MAVGIVIEIVIEMRGRCSIGQLDYTASITTRTLPP